MALLIAPVAFALQPGAPAPELKARTLAATPGDFQLNQWRGKVVYVDFWASWCAPCRVSFPVLDALGTQYAAQGFAVVGVNQDDAAKDRDAFVKKLPVNFTLVEDPDHQIAKAFDVKAMPSGYLVDRKGTVRFVHTGFDGGTRAKLEAQINQLLKEMP